ncbi:C-5 cytosine-specific DNA methylase [Streptococcus varani]|uniref:Cytosine-specific methyltransferase n=1 Tax=Streptococcus varani TaxID=1608583 RepID=A0A0E4H5M1_9STRE|nr:DNA cytosine methyltransferase [Streptococcus varani]CQR26169.1 C-5 cytosine-specific DNA methylase [Streptococcus varani]
MKFLDLFAGIGGFRLGLEAAGHECIGFCEIDKFARASYKAIHNTEGEVELHDITTVSDESIRGLGTVDIICGGFPCQAFSIAGNRRGFQDTRGTLFFEIARFASILRPTYLFLENVKGLLNHEGGTTFETIITVLDDLGYNLEWEVLNSKDFGVPQNRERVFIIGHLRGRSTRRIFPLGGESPEPVEKSAAIKVIGNTKNPESSMLGTKTEVYDPTGISGTLMATDYKGPKQIIVKSLGNVNPSGNGMNGEVYQADGLAPTLTTNKGEGQKIAIPVLTPDRPEKRQNGRRFKENGEPMFTLTAQDHHGVVVAGQLEGAFEMSNRVYDPVGLAPTLRTMQGGGNEPKIIQRPRGENKGGFHDIAPTVTSSSYHENNHLSDGFRIRKLTPRECWRLQGFPDEAFDKAQAVNSNSQLYKQAGNSVTVNVIYAIASRMETINDRQD